MATLLRLEMDRSVKIGDFDLDLGMEMSLWAGRGHLLHYVTDHGWWTLDMRELSDAVS